MTLDETRLLMLDLIDEPDLLDRLSELDRGLADADSRPYVAPQPLLDRLLIPEANGRWRSNATFDSPRGGALDRQAAAEFEQFDNGLLDDAFTASSVFTRRPEIAAKRREQHVILPQRPAAPKRAGSPLMAGWLMVFVMLGASGAGVMFHKRLTIALAHISARLP